MVLRLCHLYCFRLCPGRHLALSSVWIVVATVLATFHIAKAKDEYGKEIDVSGDYTDGLVRYVR